MKNKLDIQWFIEQHSDWEKLLSEKPYCIQITRDRMFDMNLIMFKYNQIESDFNINLVRECRGIILDEDTLEVISYAFDKFGNINESYVPNLDSKSMRSSVKIDGSIFKIVRLGDYMLMSTNGTINAYNAPVADQIGCRFKSFGEIAEDVIIKKFGCLSKFRDILTENITYIFELVSPWTRVVTPFHENDMYFIGCRNNKTFEEYFYNDINLSRFFKTPDILDFSSIEKCFEYAKILDWTNEGFVVMDKNFNRVKVKNPTWLSVHHLCNNHTMSYERAIEIIKENELDEVLAYFQEFKEHLEKIRDDYNKLRDDLSDAWKRYDHSKFETRKESAIWIQKNFRIPGVGFSLIDKKTSCVDDWMKNCPSKNLVKYLGYKSKD